MKKKKVIIAIIIGVILLFPVLRNAFTEAFAPDKVLVVGNQINAQSFQFTKEIKDEKKIADFERIFDEISFVEVDWKETTSPHLIVQINHKRGIFTHPLKIWISGDRGIAQMYTIEQKMIGKLSVAQIKALQEILN